MCRFGQKSEVFENEVWRYAKFSEALKSGTKVDYNRTKILFIGQERVGKTSTIKSLLYGTFDKEEASTRTAEQRGVDIKLAAHCNDVSVPEHEHLLSQDLLHFSKLEWTNRAQHKTRSKEEEFGKNEAILFYL